MEPVREPPVPAASFSYPALSLRDHAEFLLGPLQRSGLDPRLSAFALCIIRRDRAIGQDVLDKVFGLFKRGSLFGIRGGREERAGVKGTLSLPVHAHGPARRTIQAEDERGRGSSKVALYGRQHAPAVVFGMLGYQ